MKMTYGTIKKIEEYEQAGVFNSDIYRELLKATTRLNIVDCFIRQLDINEITQSKIVSYTFYNVLVHTYLKEAEFRLIHFLIKNNGVTPRSQFRKQLFNRYQTRCAIERLYELDIIETIDFESNDQIIIINPAFRKKVDHDAR